MTKHEEILRYIRELKVGTKVSVRSIAVELNVSEGTAYRAIKDAEMWGLVSAIPRVGTIRIEKVEKKNIETLTYGEVVNIVDGVVLGGKEGLYKPLNKFIIGAMTIDAMKNYITPGNLLIVGNREEAFKLALENGCAVLITGGFGCSDEIRRVANEHTLPVISSSYDTFTIATMINKAISESLIKKEIILVEDIVNTKPVYLYSDYTVGRWKKVMQETGFSKFPVLDDKEKLVGVITTKDLSNDVGEDEPISKIMTKDPVSVTERTSVAYAAHIMVWDSLELIPVVDNKKLVGIISRGDVLKALQHTAKQPQVSETIEDMVIKNFSYEYVSEGINFYGRIIPEMYDPAGSASMNCLTMLMSTACTMSLRQKNHFNIFEDSFTAFYMKPVQIDSRISMHTRVINSGRNFAKVEVEMYDDRRELCAKGMLSAKIMKNK
jgi:Predicted transcriptional regulator containing CBS domains